MEVSQILGRSLLLAAVFGLAGLAQAEELGYISTDSASAPAEADAQVPAAPPVDSNASYTYAPAAYEAAPQQAMDIFEINGYLNAGGMFNTHSANYNMIHANSDNQIGADGAYAAIVKKAQTGCGVMDWGFGADGMFGRDARFLHGYTGLDDDCTTGHRAADYNGTELTEEERAGYGFAMPQLYGELSLNNWAVKVGHFYTLMGYESARADNRFFYSFGRNFEVTPITHTGSIATYRGLKNMEWSIGWVAGENNTFDRGYDESLIHGGVKLMNGDLASLKYSFIAGDGAMVGNAGSLFRNDVVLTAKLNCCWETAFIFNYGSFDAGDDFESVTTHGGNVTDLAQLYGNLEYQTWAGYLFYTVNSKWKIGTRTEWQRGTTDADGSTEAAELFNIGVGANWTPLGTDFLVIRPEIRYDDSHMPLDYEGAYGNDRSFKDQFSLGADLLCKF